jgi:ASCH domain
MTDAGYVLSIKQPWAALIVHGLKTIEVRRWATEQRGTIFIHASRQCDHRPEAWSRLPNELHRAARLSGGIVGAAELSECLTYDDSATFAADSARHLNDPCWFQPPQMYGFVFARSQQLPFHACRGWFRFFRLSTTPAVQLPLLQYASESFVESGP